ncbi:hypothetical protein NDU88_011393 [Pleurodeles waltl]|uniref:t-SNARE coiled-coil homology domain-containing protein n=1 Tax=Pleurodeles waltl TaxID=8319 RepID=A0AAV7PYQ4_PLEWA|nr:hypothetical protein NDU88_011393 [Pleurodeles waltl]
MGKSDKNKPKLHFDQRKAHKTVGEHMAAPPPTAADTTQEEEPELKQIQAAMQQSLAQIDSKIDSLSFRMDRMTERLNKHAERLDESDRRISDIEDSHTTLTSNHESTSTTLAALQRKVNNLKARSRRNNLHVVGIAKSTDIDNMEGYIECLLTQLLGGNTFSNITCSRESTPLPGSPLHCGEQENSNTPT